MPVCHHHTDILIVGAGGAGLMAAYHARQGGYQVMCVSKVHPTASHTVAAQGGINAALGNVAVDDWRWHAYDTVRGSDWLGDQDAIALMCERAPETLRLLEQLGVSFTRLDNGKIYQRVYGGQSMEFGQGGLAHRACAAADRTGHALIHTLYDHAKEVGTHFFDEFLVIDLLMSERQACQGVLMWEMATGTLHAIHAQATIMATGGYGQIYAINTSSSICTGDGNAMIARAGLPLADMEFVQFHPTGLAHSGYLITEAARAEGGYLTNGRGEKFMQHYAARYGDLASRDVIARAMATEIAAGRGAGPQRDHLWLHLEHLDPVRMHALLPTVCETAWSFARIDPTKDPIPVAPSAHYTMGGIATNTQAQVMDHHGHAIDGLFAIGEAACVSVHGANRLGCNSLLDILVFAKVAIETCQTLYQPGATLLPIVSSAYEAGLTRFERLRTQKGEESVNDIRRDLRQTMQQYVGVYRNADGLEHAYHTFLELRERLSDAGIHDYSNAWNAELIALLETENLLLLATLTTYAARMRTESRGSHYREDYPQRDDQQWLQHSVVTCDNHSGRINHALRPVRLTTNHPEMPSLLPEGRSY
jgi:succinate dehydrogenase / fumarate reductase flavoprotein subunit